MQIHAYLIFDGHAKAAFDHYARALGGTIAMITTFGDMPGCEDMPDAAKIRIAHVRLEVGDAVLMASDSHPDHPFDGSKGFSVSVSTVDSAEATRVFDALAAGGHVTMPMQETAWSSHFGMLVDRFGVSWMVNCLKVA